MKDNPSTARTYSRAGTRRRMLPLLAALVAVSAPTSAAVAAEAQSEHGTSASQSAISAAIADKAGKLSDFYRGRGHRPLWLAGNRPGPQAAIFVRLLESADLDGLKPRKLGAGKLAQTLDKSYSGDAQDLAKAEIALSRAFAAYVRALRKLPGPDVIYESDALKPAMPTQKSILLSAASAPSLASYLTDMEWMNPLYAPMRKALANPAFLPSQRGQMVANLARIRALPADRVGRYILVDVASARLWMYEKGKPAGTMKVVVGRADQQTPMMAGFLRYVIVNPYWNVPEDLVRTRIAANVLTRGLGYFQASGYQVLADWSNSPVVVDPKLVNWAAVANGAPAPRVRQLPGKVNFMGKVKFMFPNEQGIYLHDTPEKELMLKEARQFSSGCIRLENADRLGRWLLGKPLPKRVPKPEVDIPLPQVVPIYITYLTAFPTGNGIAFQPDVYGWDGKQLARN